MVEFETQVYHKEGTNIIGAEVIVIAENGERLDTLQITSKTDFDELVARLATLTEEFISFDENSPLAGMSIDEVLENSPQIATINATQLGGYNSNEYSKAGHQHSLSDISNLYNVDLSVSNNAPVVGEQITVTAKVTNTLNQPVASKSLVIYLNGSSWKTGSTDSSGVFSTSYTVENDNPFVLKTEQEKIIIYPQHQWIPIDVPVGTLRVNPKIRLAEYGIYETYSLTRNAKYDVYNGNAVIPSAYRPVRLHKEFGDNSPIHPVIVGINTEGKVWIRSEETDRKTVDAVFLYRY